MFLNRNKEIADKILERIKYNEMIRSEFQKVQKEAREKSKKVALNIPKLKDCKVHDNDENPKYAKINIQKAKILQIRRTITFFLIL